MPAIGIFDTGIFDTPAIGFKMEPGAFKLEAFYRIAFFVREWYDVEENQTPNWGGISDSQTPNWVAVNDAQSVTWTPVT